MCEAVVNARADSWDFDRVYIPDHLGRDLTDKIEAYALGVDNSWYYLGTTNQVFRGIAAPPPHPRMVVVLP